MAESGGERPFHPRESPDKPWLNPINAGEFKPKPPAEKTNIIQFPRRRTTLVRVREALAKIGIKGKGPGPHK